MSIHYQIFDVLNVSCWEINRIQGSNIICPANTKVEGLKYFLVSGL